jgi:hypothetical protein
MDDDDDPVVICCAGPPLCLLEGEAAVAASQAGCELCTRIVVHRDGSETVQQRKIN